MNACPCCNGASGSASAPPRPRPRRVASPEPSGLRTDGACRVFTFGHSTRPIDDFIALLTAHGVTQLVDVRTVPRSRHNPQFNAETLPARLAAANIGYAHAEGLGGFRRPTPDSPNAGWRNLSFRGYADYMQTPDFADNLIGVIELADEDRVALMCAEAVPWRCHRSLIADALLVHGVPSCEIVGPDRLQMHRLTPFAQVSGDVITSPPERAGPTP
jgi:uncharacterized protein (DUF488 family)